MPSGRRRTAAALLALAICALLTACSTTVVKGSGRYSTGYPQVAADFAQVVTTAKADVAVPGAKKIAAADGRLTTPHGGTTQTSVLAARSLSDKAASAVGVTGPKGVGTAISAPPGHQLLVVTFSAADTSPRFTDATTTQQIAVGTSSIDVDLHGTYDATARTWAHPYAVVVLSVPLGSPVQLQVTDSAKTATLDLRTGTRAADAGTQSMAVLAGDHTQVDLGAAYTASGTITTQPPAQYVAETIPYSLAFDLAKARADLEPWRPTAGWAPAGQAWLFVDDIGIADPTIGKYGTGSGTPLVDFSLATADSFTLTPTGAAAVTPEAQTILVKALGNYFPDGNGLVLAVPDTFRTGTLTLAPTGSFTVKYVEGDVPATWQQAPTPYSVEIDLGK